MWRDRPLASDAMPRHVFFVTGAAEENLLAVASPVATPPGVPLAGVQV